MISVGISEGFHDAAMSVIRGQDIVYASHSERYSKKKNDRWIHKKQWDVHLRQQDQTIGNLRHQITELQDQIAQW